MGWQIIKQPNGKYCIFSSVVDNVIYYDGTREQIVNAFLEPEIERIKKHVNEVIDQLEKGEKPYFQFTKSFDEMVDTVTEIHGKKKAEELKRLFR
jgi:septation ring formation regulator EzrA